jgi:hypothetical protein
METTQNSKIKLGPESHSVDQPVRPLLDFIREVEDAHFRTECDTGANLNVLLIWNLVRKEAGLPWLQKSDLPTWDGEKYAMPADSRLLSNVELTCGEGGTQNEK